jgi:excisionase family DNA binding protein
MVQGYYTLDEAAHILGMDADKLSHMAQRREIRAFADRGTWRFRTQDVEEMARRLGMGSSPDMPLGEARPSRPTITPPKGSTQAAESDEGTLDVPLLPEDDIHAPAQDIVIESPSSAKLAGANPTAKPVTPKPGSDSDVHLVFDVAGDVPVIHDSDVKLEEAGPTSKPGSGRKTPPPTGGRKDSGVRLVPLDEDAGTPGIFQPTASDSDIRLEPAESHRVNQPGAPAARGPSDTSLTTEEINLDEVLQREEDASKVKGPKPKVKPKSHVKAGEGTAEARTTGPKSPAPRPRQETADELRLEPLEDEEVSLGDLEIPSDLAGAGNPSGINLHSPADSGINLGKPGGSDDSLEFELSLEQEATPKPAAGAEGEKDSSGEFELTLDEASGLAPLEEEATEAGEGEKDIFETDFDMPALDEESGSEAVALEDADTDLESSDFDLSLGEEESGSQVVALDEEEADEGAATVARRPARGGAALEEDEAGDIDELLAEDVGELEPEEEERELGRQRAPAAVAAPAPWGVLPAAVMIPCAVVMLLLSFMSFELLHNMWGYQQPYKPTATIVKWLSTTLMGEKIPD